VTTDVVQRGESRAFWEEALLSEPRDLRFYAPDGAPWCRYGRGFECMNGDACMNHERPPSPATPPGASSTAEHPRSARAIEGSSPSPSTIREAHWIISVSLPHATFGLLVDATKHVVGAPPIARYTIGWHASRAKNYFRDRPGATVTIIELTSARQGCSAAES
jgi:hypothetical protein